MVYRYETHCHSAQCSACAHSTAQEMVVAYQKAGFTGLVLTDHFIYGNTAVSRNLPWAQRMACYYGAYLEARAVGAQLDFDVIFGIEHAYGDGKEVLIYGIGLDFLLENSDIPQLSLEELIQRVHRAGGLVIQAHPYRDRPYINMAVEPRRDLIDGVEVYNVCDMPGDDARALELARERDYIITCGGDIHLDTDPRLGLAGIALPYRVGNEREFVAALKRRDHQYIVNGQVLPRIERAHLP